MDEKELKEYLKENLSIQIDTFKDYGSKGFIVQLILKDEVISEDRVHTAFWQD